MISPTPPVLLVHLLMLISTSLVATSFIVVKAITPNLAPTALVFLRFFFAAVLFFPWILWKHGFHLPSSKSLLGYGIISGALVAFFWLMFISLRFTSPLHTGVIFTMVPGLSGLIGMIFIKEQLGKTRLLALIPAMIGALWVIFEGKMSHLLELDVNIGDLLFFIGCLFIALYMPLVKKFHRGEPMAIMTFWILATGSCWLLFLGGYQIVHISWLEVDLYTLAGVFYLAIFTTVITFFISQWATLHLGPTRVFAYSYLYPPLIVLLEWVLGHELPPVHTLFGVILILPAMVIVQRGANQGKGSH